MFVRTRVVLKLIRRAHRHLVEPAMDHNSRQVEVVTLCVRPEDIVHIAVADKREGDRQEYRHYQQEI